MTTGELRNELLALLSDLLGTYTNGAQTQPALNVGAASPKGYTIQGGLEVVIYPTPEMRLYREFGEGGVTRMWRVVLKAWGAVDLVEPTERILKAYPDAPEPQPVPETDISIGQMTVFIPDPQIL